MEVLLDRQSNDRPSVMRAILAGRDALVVQPTGAGKSRFYFEPATSSTDQLTLVISPLISLMDDQVERCRRLGIAAAAIHGGLDLDTKKRIWLDLQQKKLRLLFVSPERLAIPEFRLRLVETNHVRMVAIDEAHCIAQWGGHFRPEYRRIMEYLRDFPRVQKIALTATATKNTRREIIDSLGLHDPVIHLESPLRPNIRNDIIRSPTLEQQWTVCLQAVLNTSGARLVYASTRKQVEILTKSFNEAGLCALAYHAGMDPRQRQENFRCFLRQKDIVVVATNAFGLGIDRGDIRLVFHAGITASIEAYVQEIGRAGRDGSDARALMVYTGRDLHVQKFMLERCVLKPTDLRSLNEWFSNVPSRSAHEVLDKLRSFDVEPEASLSFLMRYNVLREIGGRFEILPHDQASISQDLQRWSQQLRQRFAMMRNLAEADRQHRSTLMQEYFR